MRRNVMLGIGGLLVTAPPLAAQDNPFALSSGPVKSAYIVYDVSGKQKQAGQGGSYEVAVARDRWVMRMMSPFEMAGKKDTLRVLAVTTSDSQYTYNALGSQPAEGEAGPTLRPYLAREYAALDAASKARFRQNVKLAAEGSGSSDVDRFPWLTGEKSGSETIAGHKCDVYVTKGSSACVLPQSPMVMLRWQSQRDGVNLVAKKVVLNGPIPANMRTIPKGVAWKSKPYDDADFITGIWEFKKQSDPSTVAPGTLTQFAVRYLASPQATTELREMRGPSEETGEAPADTTE